MLHRIALLFNRERTVQCMKRMKLMGKTGFTKAFGVR